MAGNVTRFWDQWSYSIDPKIVFTWQNNHSIDFDGATVIDKGNYRVRRTLESWHTAKTVGADNNSKPLSRQYSILL